MQVAGHEICQTQAIYKYGILYETSKYTNKTENVTYIFFYSHLSPASSFFLSLDSGQVESQTSADA